MKKRIATSFLFLFACVVHPPGVWETPGAMGLDGCDPQLVVESSEALRFIRQTKGDVLYSSSSNEGDSFALTSRANEDPGSVHSHGENAPQLRLGKAHELYVCWESQGDILFSRSISFGRQFDKPVRISDDPGRDFQSFHAMEVRRDGVIFAAWIDFRSGQGNPPGTAAVFLSRSTDRGASFARNTRVAAGACPCCRPAVTFGPGQEVYVTWRHVYSDGERDLACAVSRDDGETWSEPVRVAYDRWRLDGCPHSGPSAVWHQESLWVIWYTGGQGKASLRLSRSMDNGKSFSSPLDLHGTLFDANHPHAAVVADEVWVIFQAREKGDSEWSRPKAWVVRISSAGNASRPQPLPSLGGSVSYPRLAPGNAGRLYATWTETKGDASQVVICRGRLKK